MTPDFLYGTAWKEERTAALVELALREGFRGIDTANPRRHYFEGEKESIGLLRLRCTLLENTVGGERLVAQRTFDLRRPAPSPDAPGGVRASWQPWVAMGSAKAALESLVRYFAVALAPRGITVNAVSPGLTDDSVLQSFGDAAVDIARKWHGSGWTPMGRMGTPGDIGNVVGLLCSPDAAWITGQVIHADGGGSLVDTHLPLEIQRG